MGMEGTSGQLSVQRELYGALSLSRTISSVCETGFGAGVLMYLYHVSLSCICSKLGELNTCLDVHEEEDTCISIMYL